MSSFKFFNRPLTINDKEEVEKLLIEYVKEEPTCRFLNLSEEEKQTVVKSYLTAALNGVSIGFFEKETEGMIGVGVVTVPGYHLLAHHFAGPDGKFTKKLQLLADFDCFMERGASEYIGSNNLVSLEGGYIKPKYRSQGLHRVLANWMDEVGRILNCGGVTAVGNLSAIARPFLQKGFEEVKKVYFKEYRDPTTAEAVFANLSHDERECAVLLVKRIKPLSSKL